MSKQTPLKVFGIIMFLVLTLGFSSATSSSSLSIATITAPTSVLENAGTFTFTFNLTYSGSSQDINLSFNTSTVSPFGLVSIPNVNNLNGSIADSKIVIGTISNFSAKGGQSLVVSINASTITGTTLDDTNNFTVNILRILGCTDPTAQNYNSSATYNDGSCNYTGSSIPLNFCPSSSDDDDIDVVSVNDNSDVDDDWEWKPYQDAEVSVKIKNNLDDDEEFVVSLIFVDNNGDIVELASDEDDLEDDVSIDEGDKETITFNFEIDGDVDEGQYTMYVKVYKDGGEDEDCITYTYQDDSDLDNIKIEKKTRDVVVDKVEGPQTAKAGQSITFEVDLINIGSKDEEKVKIVVYNKDLGILNTKEIDNLDEGDEDSTTIIVNIPEDANEGDYTLSFSTEFDYDEDDEKYDEESDVDDDFEYKLSVLEGVSNDPMVRVKLLSEAVVGKDLEVEVKIKNNEKSSKMFSLFAEDYSSWADSAEFDDSSFQVGSDDTVSTILRLTPKESGRKSFTLVVDYDGKQVEQEVSVTLKEPTGFLSGVFSALGMGTAGVYLIGSIIVLAILILLVLIIKLVKPRKA